MKHVAACLLCLLLVGSLRAQEMAPQVGSIDDALAQIDATRVRENAVLDAKEAQCYKNFAVNRCLKSVQSQRTVMQRELKRQETALHDAERKQQGIDALARIQEKARDKTDKDAQAALDASSAAAQDRLQAQKDKQVEHAAKASSAANAASGVRETSAPTAAQQAQNREAYANKLAEAAKKREASAKRASEKTGKPLPPVPSASQSTSPAAPASQPQ